MMNTAAATFANTDTVKKWNSGQTNNPVILKLRKERDAEILMMYNSGMLPGQIASKVKLSRSYVSKIIRTGKLKVIASKPVVEFIGNYPVVIPAVASKLPAKNVRSKTRPVLKERNEQICKMYTDGKKVSEIASEMNMCSASIYNILKAHGIVSSNPNNIGTSPEGSAFRKDRKEKMLKLRSEGMSNREIAIHMQCAKSTVIHAIGHQPAEMTDANRKMGYEIRKLKNKTRNGVVDAINKQPEPEFATVKIPADPIIPMVSDELVAAVAEKLFVRVIDALKGIA